MAKLIDALWDPPPDDAPDAQVQAYRLMMQILKDIQSRVPTVLSEPLMAGGEKTMLAAIGASLNPKIASDRRNAALMMLQKRMRSVDPTTPQRGFAAPVEDRSTISRTWCVELEALDAFEAALEAYILQVRPGRGHRKGGASNIEPLVALGLLVAMLVVRLGQGSMTVLAKVAQEIGKAPWVGGRWAWVDLDLGMSGQGASQMHRLHMDPTTLVAWLQAGRQASALPRPGKDRKSGAQIRFYKRLVVLAFKALLQSMQKAATEPVPNLTLDKLREAMLQRLLMTSMPMLVTYAKGDIVSSSLETGTWLRLLGYRAPNLTSEPDPRALANDDDLKPAALESDEPQGIEAFAEQVLQGDLQEEGLISRLRRILGGAREGWKVQLGALIGELEAEGSTRETARLVVSWLRYLGCERRHMGKALGIGTVNHYRALLANRALEFLPNRLSDLDEEELLEAYMELIMSRHSIGQTRRLTVTLASFDHYVRAQHLPHLPHVQLKGFSTGNYAISSLILVEDEFQRGFAFMDQGALAFTDTVLADQTRAFWILGFRLAMRRKEILGLQARDLDGELIRVRPNAARQLKTSNAHRTLPLLALSVRERGMVMRLAQGRDPEDYLFFRDGIPGADMLEGHPVVGKINALLERVTGDRRLHPHSLRHSTATLTVFGALASDLRIDGHPSLSGWMKKAIEQSAPLEAAVSGQLCRRGGRGSAIAMAMGHGSELTTYEHYVHCLDLLLFLSCWSGRFNERPQQLRDRYGPPRHEAPQLLAMLGYEPTTRIEWKKPDVLMALIAKHYPDRVEWLEPRNKTLHEIVDSPYAIGVSRLMDLRSLMARPEFKELSGYPTRQVELDTVAHVAAKLARVAVADRSKLQELAAQWVAARMENYDWASMSAKQAHGWVSDLKQLTPDLGVEAMHVFRSSGSPNKHKIQVDHPNDPASYQHEHGRYWMRVADPCEREDKRRVEPKVRRSRTQRSISWLLTALARMPWGV